MFYKIFVLMENLELVMYYVRMLLVCVIGLVNYDINIFDVVNLQINNLIVYTYLFIADFLFLVKISIVLIVTCVKLYYCWFIFNKFFFWIFCFVTFYYMLITLFCYFNVIRLVDVFIALCKYIEDCYNDLYKLKKTECVDLLEARAIWLPKEVVIYIRIIEKLCVYVYICVRRILNKFLYFIDKFGFLLVLVYIVIYVFVFYYQFDCFSFILNVVPRFDLLLFLNSWMNLGNWVDIDALLKIFKKFF